MLNDKTLIKLKELEATANDFWNIPPETGNFLNMLVKTSNYKNILEIGTSNGYSAIWLAHAVSFTKGHLVSLEFWQKRIDLALTNIEHCGLLDYVTIKCGSALTLIDSLKPSDFKDDSDKLLLDMVFIDANKGEYIQYFNLIEDKMRVGGMIIADNVESHRKQSSDFLDEIYNNDCYQVQEITFGGGILLALKIK